MTSDEEVGSPTSRALIEEEARKSAYVLVMESPLPGGVLKTSRKGGGTYTLTITGRAAHAGVEPERGISAIQELAHQILKLHSLTDMEKGSTVNVGVVKGGSVSNVVAAQAVAEIDLRAWTQAEADRLCEGVTGLTPVLPGATLEITGGWNRPPLEHAVTADTLWPCANDWPRTGAGHWRKAGPAAAVTATLPARWASPRWTVSASVDMAHTPTTNTSK